jgi:membrane-bound serine protease (ClpP class)
MSFASATRWIVSSEIIPTGPNYLAGGLSAREIRFMKRILHLAAALASLATAGAAEKPVAKDAVVVVPVEGPVSEAQFFFIRRIFKQAESAGAAAIILDMNTPGGSLQATEDIVQMFMKSRLPVYTYVNTNAGSAGALIALGTKKVYMAPVSAIGAAAPVVSSGQEIPATMNAKIVSYFSGYFRSVAAQNGYHPELVDGFMNLEKEVKIGDEVINPKGGLLTLSAQEAVKPLEGKPLLASGIADDVASVCTAVGLPVHSVVEAEPSGFEILAQWVTMLAPLFLLGGAIGAYIEFKTPGFGVAGIVSACCFLLFFAGHYIAGLTGLEVAAVFLLGIALIVLELVLFPGVVFLATLGTALMIGAVFFAMVDFYPAQPLDLSFALLARPMLNLGIAITATVLAMSLLARFLPDLPVFRRIFLATSATAGPSLPQEASAPSGFHSLRTGDSGVALSILRPAGQARFGDTLVDVVADGTFIDSGETIRILAVEGSRIVVEKYGNS